MPYQPAEMKNGVSEPSSVTISLRFSIIKNLLTNQPTNEDTVKRNNEIHTVCAGFLAWFVGVCQNIDTTIYRDIWGTLSLQQMPNIDI